MSSDIDLDSLAALGIDDFGGAKSKQQVDLESLLIDIEFENESSGCNIKDIFDSENNNDGTFEVELTKNTRGFGFAIKKDTDGQFYIKELLREPALTNGRIKAGDQILFVNDCVISTFTHTEAIDFLRAQPKTIKLILKRVNNESFIEPRVSKLSLPIITRTIQDDLEEEFSQADSSCSNFSSISQRHPKRDASISDSFDEEDFNELDLSGRYYKSVSRDNSRSSPSTSSPSTIGRTSSCSSRIRSQLRAEALMFVLEKASQRQSGASDTYIPNRKKLNRSHNQSKQDMCEKSTTSLDTSRPTEPINNS